MAEDQVKFLPASFTIDGGGAELPVQGLVSRRGAIRLRGEGGEAGLEPLLGRPLTVRLGRLSLCGNLARQFTVQGAEWQIVFCDMDEAKASFLEQLIKAEGVHPGWMRKYPRVPVQEAQAQGLPAVVLCMARFGGQEEIAPVVNFSLGGIRLELGADSALPELQVGSVLHFDMMTDGGGVLTEFMGEVKNVSVAETFGAGGKKTARSIGLSFLEMSPGLKKEYFGLIRDLCEAIKRKAQAG